MKRSKAILGAMLLLIMAVAGGGAVFLHSAPDESAVILLENKNELIDSTEYELHGVTNVDEITIELNDTLLSRVSTENGVWEYVVDLSALNRGWNYINVLTGDGSSPESARCGGAINMLPDGPDVFLPDLNLFDARVNGNGANHKPSGYYSDYLVNGYEWNGPYWRAQPTEESDLFRFDERGIPEVLYGNEWAYNPVTVAQHGLGLHRLYMDSGDESYLNDFLNVADWLCEAQNENGSYPYSFSFALKPTLLLDEGFVSGMAQGQVLSCLIRAYDVTGEYRYLEAGSRALEFMTASGDIDTTKGCLRSLRDFCSDHPGLQWCKDMELAEEYVSNPSSYVLNGDLLALIGLYDWSQGAPPEYGGDMASKSFLSGLRAVEIILPYYDYYGWSAYDLLQYTHGTSPFFTSGYAHDVHIQTLHTLYEISGDEILAEYRNRFIEYNDDSFWRQTSVLYDGGDDSGLK